MKEKLFLHHKWAELGLVPPYTFEELVQGHSYCDACGTKITYVYRCTDKHGKKFEVGSDCIRHLNCSYLTTQAELAKKELEKQKKDAKRLERLAKKNAELAEKQRLWEIENQLRIKENIEKLKVEFPTYAEYITWAGTDEAPPYVKAIRDSMASKPNYRATYNQLSALEKAFKSHQLSLKPKSDCPSGMAEITGEIVSVKSQQYGYHSTLKMVVQDDRGFRVFGTVPACIQGKKLTGCKVTLTAFLEPSKDDTTFGFYSRPKLASLLE